VIEPVNVAVSATLLDFDRDVLRAAVKFNVELITASLWIEDV
jgi:hypothetical protein